MKYNDLPPFMARVRSRAFKDILEIARRAARFDTSVLLSGETGVGKEIIARYMHSVSRRRGGPLITINCGALPETLLESELFGHKAGSFTGAVQDRVGLFEQAARGTVFLDEIGDISLNIQVKLLRVLQEREITRIGENIPRRVDIRIIAATNCDLDEAVKSRKFREDLLYRLRVIEIEVPPLRERPEDIPFLIGHITDRLSENMNLSDLEIEPECIQYLTQYHWPGNVRELQNVIERAAVLSTDGRVRPEHLPRPLRNPNLYVTDKKTSQLRTLSEMELDYIKKVLQSTNDNRTRAAKILGIGQATLWRKLKNINL